MNKDKLYQDIVEGLKGDLDYDVFEQCAADLIREDWPVVPVKGGSDAGMDGAIADGQGEAFPLVTTTAEDAIGNLTRNLRSYEEEKGNRSRVIFATSRSLTPQRRRNLEERAQELGFTLVQIYDQIAIARLLYRNPEWCKELLGISGDPSPLSIIPKTRRPLLDQPLVGRDEELEWLTETEGDRLLVGQPGSGKTFLLYRLALDGEALFVTSWDRDEIAAGLRAQQPTSLIVDDARGEEELIDDLRQLRRDTGASFSILASCWPGDKSKVKQYLGISEERVLELPLLTRKEVVEVINGAGLRGPRELIHSIVDQAEGRPGFAVTLANFCLQGGVREVVHGDVLSENILSAFEPTVGPEAEDILAVLSVGGEAGMPMGAAADILRMELAKVRQVLNELAAAGVIMEVSTPGWQDGALSSESYLQVRPDVLRHALIRDVFFEAVPSLSIEEALEHAPSTESSLITLIGAKARGATVNERSLRRRIEREDSRKVWRAFASVGEEEARWILQSHPEKIGIVAHQAISNAPRTAIPLLLDEAIGDNRSLSSNPGHPIRALKEWVLSGRPGSGEALNRRKVLFSTAQEWIEKGGDAEVGIKAMRYALSPNFEAHPTSPEGGMIIQQGILTPEEIESIITLWKDFWEFVDANEIRDWKPIIETLHHWIHPGHVGGEVTEETAKQMVECAREQVKEAVSRAAGQPGILRKLAPTADKLGVNIDLSGYKALSVLYPQQDLENYEEASERQAEAVRDLAKRWEEELPRDVADKIKEVEDEARSAGLQWPRYTKLLCEEIAKRTDNPLEWLDAFLEHNFNGRLLAPFLQRAADIGADGWREQAEELLDRPNLKWPVLQIALTQPDKAAELVGLALSHLDGCAEAIKTLYFQKDIPEGIAKQLLTHKRPDIRRAAAEGEWRSEPDGQVRESLFNAWRDVVINDFKEGYWLPDVFEANPEMGLEWIQNQLGEDDPPGILDLDDEKEIQTAIRVIDHGSRRKLLDELRDIPQHLDWAKALVGSDAELYQNLLEREEVQRLHLAPLQGRLGSDNIIQMISHALNAGHTPKKIAEVCNPHLSGFVKSFPERYEERASHFERLEGQDDPRIQKVGEIGRRIAERRAEKAKERIHKEAVYGYS